MFNLYEVLVRLCEAKGVTLSQMCKDNGWYYSFVTDLKSGRKTSVAARNLEQLSEYFSVPVSTFFEDVDNPFVEKQDELFEEKKLLFDISNKATKEQLDQIIEIAKVITKK